MPPRGRAPTRGTGKKKASAYDPGNPYSTKPGSKSKSKAWGKANSYDLSQARRKSQAGAAEGGTCGPLPH